MTCQEDTEAFLYAKIVEEAACLAGRQIVYEAAQLRDKGHATDARTKSTFCDLVTDSDEKAEKFIVQYCKEKLGKHSVRFIGEETVAADDKLVLTNAPTIIIDPIDGTSNFVHGFPAFVVSVGVAINKQLVAGVIYDPSANDTFTAVRGHGAFRNHQQQLRVSRCRNLIDALVLGGTGGVRDKAKLDIIYKNFRAVSDRSHGIRTTGSCAYNLITVAAGRCEAFFDVGIHCWDTSAGVLIVKEAGGTVRSISRDAPQFDLMARSVLACNSSEIADEIFSVLGTVEISRDSDDIVHAL